jgi:hypothetical protein
MITQISTDVEFLKIQISFGRKESGKVSGNPWAPCRYCAMRQMKRKGESHVAGSFFPGHKQSSMV